jgi:hypothetical protein
MSAEVPSRPGGPVAMLERLRLRVGGDRGTGMRKARVMVGAGAGRKMTGPDRRAASRPGSGIPAPICSLKAAIIPYVEGTLRIRRAVRREQIRGESHGCLCPSPNRARSRPIRLARTSDDPRTIRAFQLPGWEDRETSTVIRKTEDGAVCKAVLTQVLAWPTIRVEKDLCGQKRKRCLPLGLSEPRE